MKKMMTLVMMMTIAISAAAMPYNTARNEALYLSDKMAYELGLTASQYEAVYEINLDYLLNVDTRADVFGFWWPVSGSIVPSSGALVVGPSPSTPAMVSEGCSSTVPQCS